MSNPSNGRWLLRHNGAQCGTCEVCVRHCPTGALRAERTEQVMRLLFRPGLCDGCGDGEGCEAVCTEKAIERIEAPEQAAEIEETVLVETPLVICAYCGAGFATAQKVMAVSRRRPKAEPLKQELCPLCRREHLVVSLIRDEMKAEGNPEYRSARDILRRAGYVSGKRKAP